MECVNMGDIDTRHHQKQARAVKNNIPQQRKLKSKALRWHMPVIGEVPLSKFNLFLILSFLI